MRKKCLLFLFSIFSIASGAQTITHRDPQIEMVSEISRDSLGSYIKKLARFGTRNTLSKRHWPGQLKMGTGTCLLSQCL